jgi:hypothetical protein
METHHFAKLPLELQNHIIKFLPEHPIVKNVLSHNMCVICSSNHDVNKNPHPITIINDAQHDEFGDLYCQHSFCEVCIGFNNILRTRYKNDDSYLCILCKHDISLIVSEVSDKLEYEADELAEYLINRSSYYVDDFRRSRVRYH